MKRASTKTMTKFERDQTSIWLMGAKREETTRLQQTKCKKTRTPHNCEQMQVSAAAKQS
jgi:hypothetical protein